MAENDNSPDGDGPPGSKKEKDAKRQKMLIGIGAAGLVLTVLLLRKSSGASSSTAAQAPGTDNTTQDELAGLYNDVQQLQAEMNGGGVVSNPVASAPASTAGSTTTTTTSGGSATTTAPASSIPSNAYGVGTKVTSSETIVQALYDPLEHGWIDLTSKQGLWGSGLNVSGSAYNPNAFGIGHIQLAQGGAEVQEYNSKNQLVGTYKVGK